MKFTTLPPVVAAENPQDRDHGKMWVSDIGPSKLYQRIPNTLESQALEVFHVGGGKLRDAVGLERFGQTDVEDSAAGNMFLSGKRPHLTHDVRAIDQLPSRMSSK